ncbi:MAG TPA: MobA/MobL family protein, partial [Hyphomicrobiales bacterium]|nr:MobA/MobL family protein [Hyphomicrobiales bacterium]
MAIYSFNHDSLGKTTNRAGAAGDNAAYNARENETRLDKGLGADFSDAARNAAYNAREEATYAVRSHIIPADPKEAEAWFRQQEQGDRKNARMSDRFIGALPRELTPKQCIEAVETFCRDITQDRIPWHFALHLELDKKHEPDWNPHAHIIFRDRDIETGRRFLFTSAHPKERAELAKKGVHAWTTKDFRLQWEGQMNRALERAGYEARIDHRSLKEQGIDRDPQIHIGPGSQNAAKKGHEFESRDRLRGERTIPYSILDHGSRAQHNERIMQGNRQPTASREHPDHLTLRKAQA